MINPTVNQVKSIIVQGLSILGNTNRSVHALPAKEGTDVTFTELIVVYRPYVQHGCQNPRVSLTEYRKFFRKIDALCVYLEENLTLSEEITIKEIQNDQKDQDHYHSVCIAVNVTVFNLPADAPVS